MNRARVGDADAMERIQRLGGEQIFVRLNEVRGALREHGQLIHMVNQLPDATPAERRQLIDSIYYGMIQMGRAGMQMIRETDRALQQPLDD